MTWSATLGFERLAELTDKPSMDNLAAIFGAIRAQLGVDLELHTVEMA